LQSEASIRIRLFWIGTSGHLGYGRDSALARFVVLGTLEERYLYPTFVAGPRVRGLPARLDRFPLTFDEVWIRG
jgi:hypothetical protein